MLLDKCLQISNKQIQMIKLRKLFRKLSKSDWIHENTWYFNQLYNDQYNILIFMLNNNICIKPLECTTITDCIFNCLINNIDISAIHLYYKDKIQISFFGNLLDKLLYDSNSKNIQIVIQHVCEHFVDWALTNKYLMRSDITQIYEKFKQILLYVSSFNNFRDIFNNFEYIKKDIYSKNTTEYPYLIKYLRITYTIFIKDFFYILCIRSQFKNIDIVFRKHIQILKPILINFIQTALPSSIDSIFEYCLSIKQFLNTNIFKFKSQIFCNKYLWDKCCTSLLPCTVLLYDEPSSKKIQDIFEEFGSIRNIYTTLKMFNINKLRNILRIGIKYLFHSEIDEHPQGIIHLFYIKYVAFILKSVYIEDINSIISWYRNINFPIENTISTLLLSLTIPTIRIKKLVQYIEHIDISLIRFFFNKTYNLIKKYTYNIDYSQTVILKKKLIFKEIIKRDLRLSLILKCKIRDTQPSHYISSFIDDIIELFSIFPSHDYKLLSNMYGIKQSLNIIIIYETLNKLECENSKSCCSICYMKDDSITKSRLPCGHTFHKECISESIQYTSMYDNYMMNAKCPYCTQNIFKLMPKDNFYNRLNHLYLHYNETPL